MKTYNTINCVSLFLILCGAGVMFAVARNILLGVMASITFVTLLVSFVLVNKSVERSNFRLLGQKVKVTFTDEEMIMTATLGEVTLYTAHFTYDIVKSVKVKDNLIYIKYTKDLIVAIPTMGFKKEADFTKALQYLGNNYII